MLVGIISAFVSDDKETLHLEWADGHTGRFYVKWLRFHCQCKLCVPKFKGTYLIDMMEFPPDLCIQEAELCANGEDLRIRILGEIVPDHVTRYTSQWLRERCNCDSCLSDVIESRDVISRYGIASGLRSVPTIQYHKLIKEPDETAFVWAKHLVEHGFCLIKNVPPVEGMIAKVVKIIAPLRDSSYGLVSDVHAKGSKEHGSSGKTRLPLHQDAMHYEHSPGFLALHCLKFDKGVTGGHSKLVDVFYAAEILRKECPEHFKTLTEVPGSWDTINHNLPYPCHHEHQKCHIVTDYFDKITGVSWSLTMRSPIRIRESDMKRYYAALTAFNEIIEREENKISFKFEPGDLLTINNRRCAHSREVIEQVIGERHLQTVYASIDDVKSRYMYLASKLGREVVMPKVGNHSSF